jgi:hypothetical protein
MKFSQIKARLQEAATVKAAARRLMRDITQLLADKTLPVQLRTDIEGARAELRRTWKDLAQDGQAAEAAVTPEAGEAGEPVARVAEAAPIAEHEGYYSASYTYGAKSFADLEAAQAADEAANNVHSLTSQYQNLIGNVMSDSSTAGDKIEALRALSDEFINKVGDILDVGLDAQPEPDPAATTAAESETSPAGATLAESIGGAAITLLEAEPAASSTRAPLSLNVRLITPGWGNIKDRHWYGADVLKRDAKVFEGVKMYATDHRDNEKSVRTEVARIKEITGFGEDGAPIARVIVFDPDFAEQTRNRAAAGELDSLECSILAYGRTKAGKAPDGQAGNIVEAITSARSVDWVTKAGAGGRAISLAESAADAPQGEKSMLTEAEVKAALEKSALPEPARKRLAEQQFADAAALESAITAETAYLAEAAPAPTAPVALAEADVTTLLAKTTLPPAAQRRLAGQPWKTATDLDKAVVAEVDYLKSVTSSGKPVIPAVRPASQRKLAEADTEKNVDKVLDRHFSRAPGRRPD